MLGFYGKMQAPFVRMSWYTLQAALQPRALWVAVRAAAPRAEAAGVQLAEEARLVAPLVAAIASVCLCENNPSTLNAK